jgi:hypothetical protein
MDKFMEEEVQPVAVKRLERSLILDEIARAEKIEVDEESLNQEFGQTLTEMQYQGADLSKIGGGKRAQKEFAEAVAMESANRLMTRRTMERLKAIALGEAEAEENPKMAGIQSQLRNRKRRPRPRKPSGRPSQHQRPAALKRRLRQQKSQAAHQPVRKIPKANRSFVI